MINILRRIQTLIPCVLSVFALLALLVLVSCEDAPFSEDRASSSDSIWNENTIPFILFGLIVFLVILILVLLLLFALPRKKSEQAYDMLIFTEKDGKVYYRIFSAMSDLMVSRDSRCRLDELELMHFTETINTIFPFAVDIRKDRIRINLLIMRAFLYGTSFQFTVKKYDDNKSKPIECRSFDFEPETIYSLSYTINNEPVVLYFYFASDRKMMMYVRNHWI